MTAETRDAVARGVHWPVGVLGLDLGGERRRHTGLESEMAGLETGTGTTGVGHGTGIGIGTETEIAAEIVSGTDGHVETGARIPGGTHAAATGAGAGVGVAGGAEVRGRTRASRLGRRIPYIIVHGQQVWVC